MPNIPARAKINLFLEVVRKRPDGYHDIDSVFCEIDLADILSAEAAPDGTMALECPGDRAPPGGDNLIVKAAAALAERRGVRRGIHFRLDKRIPMGGGLGGGSADAAAALRLANQVWDTGLTDGELAEVGAGLGSDVPFFLHGGVCLCRGRGELVTPLPALAPGATLGLVLPDIHSDTAAAYRRLRPPAPGEVRDSGVFVAAMASGDVAAMAAAAFNRFEETVFRSLPELGELYTRLAALAPHPPRLSGSGAGLWFFADAERIEWIARKMPETRVLVTRPVSAHAP